MGKVIADLATSAASATFAVENATSSVDYVLSGTDGSANDHLKTDGSGNLAWVAPAGGKIGQVLQVYKTDAYTLSTASTWTAITDLSLTITPSAATSKVLVMANIFHSSDASGGSLMFRFVRTSTAIGIADAVGTPRLQTSFGSYIGDHSTTAEVATDMSGNTFLDSPSTTSATTYTIEGYIAGSTQYVNRSIRDTDLAGYDPRSCSSFTLMEVLV
tara:strand:- start:678 stop:1325 length:648 start_codon:yes stop_codon:yes gene_type:complete